MASAFKVTGTRRGSIFWTGTVEDLGRTYPGSQIVGYEDGTAYDGPQPDDALAAKYQAEPEPTFRKPMISRSPRFVPPAPVIEDPPVPPEE